jgi:GT2 family glycosyltransferase
MECVSDKKTAYGNTYLRDQRRRSWGKLRNEEFHDLHYSSKSKMMIKPRRCSMWGMWYERGR